MTYRLLPAVSIPSKRIGIVVDERIYHAETLYNRAMVELSERQWPVASYEFQAVDLSAMSLRADERLSLGDRVFLSDPTLGLAFWATLTEVKRALEKPFDVSLQFETRPKKLEDLLVEATDTVDPTDILPDTDGGAPGDQLIIGPGGDPEWGDSPSTHDHANKATLDEIADVSGATVGDVLTVTAGGTEWAAQVEYHSHTNLPTLEVIEDIASGAEGEVLTKVGSAAVWAATAATHSHTNKTTLDLFTDAGFNGATANAYPYKTVGGSLAWMVPDNQTVWLAQVETDQTSGGVQMYRVRLLSAVDKSLTSSYLDNCYVADDNADPLVTGQRVAVVAPSAAGVSVGQHGFIVGRFGPDTAMPAHAHISDRVGYQVTFGA